MYSCCAFVFFPSQEVRSSLKSCDWRRRQSLSCLFSTNGSAMKALEARCCYFLSVVSCCFLFNRCFSFFLFNRCLFFIQSMLSAAGSTVKAFAAYCCLLSFNCFDRHSICSKCPPLFHLIFTNLGILPITWGFLVRQDHRGTL